MSRLRPVAGIAVILLASGLCGSCLARKRLITRQGSQTNKTLINASQDTLVRRIGDLYESIKSFNAVVDMTPAVGSVYKGEITEYKDVRGYILFRKPENIRIIGLYPLVRGTAFDMVSTGINFRIYIPSKNRFVEGRNDVPSSSANKLENLRPEAFEESLLIHPVDPATEFARVLDFTDENNAFYFLLIFRRKPGADPALVRNVWFDRLTLRMVRQERYDADGSIISDTRYLNWQGHNGIPFPSNIDVNRPKDGYGVVLTVVKMEMNTEVPDQKFVLKQPEGTQLQVLSAPPKLAGEAATPDPKAKP